MSGSKITVSTPDGPREVDIYTEEGFRVLGDLWTRAFWQNLGWHRVSWRGRPVLQLPEDVVLLAELVWTLRPRWIVECGVWAGGTTLLMASVLEAAGEGTIIAVDIAPQPGTREALAVSPRVELVEGSSTDPVLGDSIRARFGREDVVLVVLDSDHTRDHVRAELEAWSPVASYIVVFDGFMPRVADAPLGSSAWTEDSPRAAIDDFLVAHPEFEVDARYAERFGATFAPSGWLRRLR